MVRVEDFAGRLTSVLDQKHSIPAEPVGTPAQFAALVKPYQEESSAFLEKLDSGHYDYLFASSAPSDAEHWDTSMCPRV